MLFPTVNFAIFFLIVLLLYWIVASKNELRKLLLLVASYYFYAYWNISFLPLLIFSSSINYLCAKLIIRFRARAKLAKMLLLSTVTVDILILLLFKYFSFLVSNINRILLILDLPIILNKYSILLPIGISFFTFQGISYIVDVYRQKTYKGFSFLDISLYIAFFPQLIAGPIVRIKEFIPQLQKKTKFSEIYVADALIRIVFGLLKKILIANYLATVFVDKVYMDPSLYSAGELLFAAYAYSIVVFCDFSAYSDMAIGLSLLFGIKLVENFDRPYSSSSIREFWRRWHISLSTWLRDYLYIPLGGKSRSLGRTNWNTILTMTLGGLWHGAAWSFVLWGFLHGLVMSIERSIKFYWHPSKFMLAIYKPLGLLLTFNLVSLFFILFRAGSMEKSLSFFEAILLGSWTNFAQLNSYLVLVFLLGLVPHLLYIDIRKIFTHIFASFPIVMQAVVLALILSLLQVVAPDSIPTFIYFQF